MRRYRRPSSLRETTLRKIRDLAEPLVRVHSGGVSVAPQKADRVAADSLVAGQARVGDFDELRVARVALAGRTRAPAAQAAERIGSLRAVAPADVHGALRVVDRDLGRLRPIELVAHAREAALDGGGEV